ncbi:murein biosynthesis integral membrane protein MurJ [Deferribacter autotrophicus]|uniref:Probable lipid II flippase MurJ n=1 Tax=Deferribacter autotrophicus TaxID=500465 RepID=A0A5A8F3M9_9BACT|nr:murein biosynthesis integral membrane protein MurJ [Deferribacter autotrophicus]KAA0258126.1 murein biosynthesis integral membrane protein MurJ [Deferribacter autotrophicus]
MKSFLFSVLKSSFGVLTSRILGLIRDVSIAAVFGANAITDIFFVAFAIPNLFRALFAEGALSSAFVPILGNKLKQNDEAGNIYLTNVLLYLSFFSLAVVIIISIFSKQTILIFMPGYSNDLALVKTASVILVIVMPYLFFVSISALFAGYLNLKGSYYIPYASTALLNLSMIISVYLSYLFSKNIYFLAWGVFFGGILQLLFVFFYAKIKGFYFTKVGKKDPDVKKTFLLIVPSILGVGVNQLNFLIGRILASFLQYGSISYLYYANRLFQFPFGLFSVTIGTVSLTELSKNDEEKRNEIISKALISIFLIIIPSTIGIVLLSDEIIKLVFQRRAFTYADVLNTSSALIMYSIGLVFFSMNMTFTKVFHSVLDTKTPVKISVVLLVSNFLFSMLLLKSLKHAGIALSATISAFIGSVIYIYLLKKRNLFDFMIFIKNKLLLLMKIIFANVLLSFLIVILIKFRIHLLLIIFATVISYYFILMLLKINIWRVLR